MELIRQFAQEDGIEEFLKTLFAHVLVRAAEIARLNPIDVILAKYDGTDNFDLKMAVLYLDIAIDTIHYIVIDFFGVEKEEVEMVQIKLIEDYIEEQLAIFETIIEDLHEQFRQRRTA